MQELFHEICQALRSEQALALATIIDDSGSTPRTSGSRLIVFADGRTSGTIGGGAIEGDVIQRALQLLETGGAEMVPYDLSRHGHTEQMDLICGGRIKVLIEHVPATRHNIDLHHCAQNALEKSRSMHWIAKITDDNGELKVERALHAPPDQFTGSAQIQQEYQRLLASEKHIPGGSSFIEFERHAYVIESITPPPTIFLFGAGHVSKDDGAEAESWTQGADFFGYMAGTE